MNEFNRHNEIDETPSPEKKHEASSEIEERNKNGLEDSEKWTASSNPESRSSKKNRPDINNTEREKENNSELPEPEKNLTSREAPKAEDIKSNVDSVITTPLADNSSAKVEKSPEHVPAVEPYKANTHFQKSSELEEPPAESSKHIPGDVYKAKEQLPKSDEPLKDAVYDIGRLEKRGNELPEGSKIVNAKDIDMSNALGMDDPNFWNHHNHTKEDYIDLASKLPDVQDRLNKGESVESLYNDPDIGAAAYQYYSPEKMVRVNERPNGLYEFVDDGRHRVTAAQELGYDIPVKVENYKDYPNSKGDEPSINEDNSTLRENIVPNKQYNDLYDYMNAHNYGIDDYEKYSKDPQWQELYNKAYANNISGPDSTEKQAGIVNKSANSIENTPNIDYNDYKGNIFNYGKLNNHYDTQSVKDAADITPEESVSLQRYTGDGYRDINKSLYDSGFQPSSDLKAKQIESDVKNISDCLDRKEIPYDSKMYRGVSDMSDLFGEDAKNLTPEELNKKYSGSYFKNDGFTSASTDKDIAKRFAETWDGGLLEMNVPKGANGMCMGEVSLYKNGEKEVLLQKGTVCRIDSIGENNGQLYVKTTVVGR